MSEKVRKSVYRGWDNYSELFEEYLQDYPVCSRRVIRLEIDNKKKAVHIVDFYEEPQKTFEQCCHEFHEKHPYLYEKSNFLEDREYTVCINPYGDCGVAKRCNKDSPDSIIGRVAAFARATGQDLDKMIGYKP